MLLRSLLVRGARLAGHALGWMVVCCTSCARADFSLSLHNQFEYAFAPHAGEFNALPLTVSLWFQTTRADGALLNKYLSGSFDGYRVQIEAGRLRAFYFRERGSGVYGPALGLRGPLVNDGRWHHAAFVVDGRRGALYLDGALVDQLAWSGRAGPCSTTEPLRLGRYETSHTADYDGALADVGVWQAAWSAEQVQQCAQGSPTGTGPGLLGHWRFLEGAGESTADLSGHGHDLRLVRCGWSTNLPPLTATDGPQLFTLAAGELGGRSARLRALGVAREPVVFFEVGLSTNLLVRRVAQIEPRTNGVFGASVLLEALEPGVTYLSRAVLSNASGLGAGGFVSFTTRRTPALRTSGADFDRLLNSPPPPRSEGVAPRTVTLRGEVHPAGEKTWAWFEWDDSDASLSTRRTVAVPVPVNDQFHLVAAPLTNLAPGKTFSARLVATNRHGSFASPPFAFQPRGGPGHALRFGASPLGSVTAGPAIPTRGDFTVECWARADGPLTGWETMLSQNGEYQSDLLLCLNPRVEPGWSATNVAFAPGRWHHVAYVRDEFAHVVRFVLDGEVVATLAPDNRRPFNGSIFQFGRGPARDLGLPWPGEIDEVRVWTTARSVEELRAARHRTLTGTEPGLRAYWRFDEPGGAAHRDLSGHDFDTGGAGETVSSDAPVDGPVPQELEMSRVTGREATLAARVSANGWPARAWLEFGATDAERKRTAAIPISTDGGALRQTISGLLPARAFTARVVASNVFGVIHGAAQTFTTQPDAPEALPLSANAVFTDGATVLGTVQPNGAATVAFLQWGVNTNMNTFTLITNVGATTEPVTVAHALHGLPPGALLHCRLVVTNAFGRGESALARFALLGVPAWKTAWFRWTFGALVLAALLAAWRAREAQLAAVMRLRTEIAGDLHDEVGGNLASIAINSELLAMDEQLGPETREELSGINRVAIETAQSVRDIVWLNNPKFDTLPEMAERMKDVSAMLLTGKEWILRVTPEPLPDTTLSLLLRRHAFLGFKEILTNIARHSESRHVEIELRAPRGWIEIRVRDDGRGFAPATVRHGHGLKSLAHRVGALGGKLIVESAPGKGTTVELRVPVKG